MTNKSENLKPLSLFVFFFALALERIFIKTHHTESTCVTGPESILFLRRVRASFSPEMLQAGAVKGLIGSVDASLLGSPLNDFKPITLAGVVSRFHRPESVPLSVCLVLQT